MSVGVAMGVSVGMTEGVAVGMTACGSGCGSRYVSVRGSVATHWTTFKPEKKSRMSEYWRL